jgi:SAM-dependent methyltransferase
MSSEWIVETGADALVSTRVTQFPYYDQVLGRPNWEGHKILDFGGNHGGFLVGAGDRVNHDDYWCMDIVRAALDAGRRQFPQGHFIHYDRYNSEYNPSGTRNLQIPDCGLNYDFILAFSVFTHIHRSELLELVEQLRRMLEPNGVLAFTFTDPSYDTGLSIFPSGRYMTSLLVALKDIYPSLDVEDTLERASQSNWSILIDDKLWVEPDDDLCQQNRQGRELESYCAYYRVEYMASLFPEAKILPPVNEEWQHCGVLGKS